MNRRAAIAAAGLAALTACPAAGVTQDAPQAAQGEVYAYGNRLSPPYVFAMEDSVLTLNGYPFFPRAYPREMHGSSPPDTAALAPVLAQVRQLLPEEKALRARALEAIGQASTRADALRAAHDIYAASPVVRDVHVSANELMVTYRAFPDVPHCESFESALRRFDPAPPEGTWPREDPARTERTVIEAVVATGGIYAFGSSYVLVKRPKSASTLRQVIAANDSSGTELLEEPDRRFLDDVRHPSMRPALRVAVRLPPEPEAMKPKP